MPGPTVGFAEIRVDFDGDRLPEQARAIAQKAGQGSGFAFTEGFDKGLSAWSRKFTKRMADAGKAGGKSFSQRLTETIRKDLDRMGDLIAGAFVSEKGFKTFAREVGGSEKAVSELNSALQRLADSGQLTQTQFKDSRASIERWANSLRASELAIEAEKKAQQEATAASKEAAEQRRRDVEERQRQAERLRVVQEQLRKENERLAASLRDVNLALANERNWKTLIRDTDDAGEATQRLNDRIEELHRNGKLSNDQVAIMRARMTELTKATDDASDSHERLNDKIRIQTTLWKRLSANTRQWTLIIGAIAASGTDIAVLGSAAGAGLTVLGAALTSTAIGAGTAIAAFRGLSGELDDLPNEVRPAAAAFQRIGKAFDTLQDKIQIAALRKAEGAFDSITKTVEDLTPAFEAVGESVGKLIDQFADGIRPGTKNFERLQKVIRNSGPIFEKLIRIAGKLGEAFLAIFASTQMQRSVDEFLGWFDEIATAFDRFANSGQLTVWLGYARQVFGSFGDLLGAAGETLNNLVDQESVGRLTDFLDNLTLFMPHLETLLEILGELDVFGLIAEALADFGEALEPLAGPMEAFAGGVNAVIEAGIDQLAGIIGTVADALAPLAGYLGDFMAENPDEVAGALLAIAGGLVAVKAAELGVTVLSALSTALSGLGTSKKVTWKLLLSGLTAAALFAYFHDEFLKAAPTVEDSANKLIGTAIIGGIAGSLFGGGTGAVIGAAIGLFVGGFFTTLIDSITDTSWLEKLFIDFDNGVLIPFYNHIAEWWNQGWADFPSKLDNGWEQIATWWEGIRTGVNTWVLDVFFPAVATWWNDGWAATVAKFANGWDQISGWWESIRTSVNTWVEDLWNGFVGWWNDGWADTADKFGNGWDQISQWFEDILADVTNWITNDFWDGVADALEGFRTDWDNFWGSFTAPSLPSPVGVPGFSGAGGGGMAAGGLVWGPQRRLIGEAGPEAVVPLNRPLSKVDPSVRELSRIAQGGLAGGGVVGGKTVIVESGAITVVTAATDGRNVANALLDRIIVNLPS